MADKFQTLIDAALTGDKAKVDAAITAANFNLWELLSLPGKFDELDPEIKRDLATVLRDHPDVLPKEATPYAMAAIKGIEPRDTGPVPSETAAPGMTMPRLRPEGAATDARIAAALAANYGGETTSTPYVRENIKDQTSTAGMTPRAMDILAGAAEAAQAAGLDHIEIVAGKGGGHLSHSEGTEWDLVGYHADGSIWTNAERVAVAEGARGAGADRFGLYQMDRGLGAGTIHVGYSGEGRPAAVWGANGLTSGAAARNFTDPSEKQFLTAYDRRAPLPPNALAYQPATSSPAGGARVPAAVATAAAIKSQGPAAMPAALRAEFAPSGINGPMPKPNERPADLRGAADYIVAHGGVVQKGSEGKQVAELQRFLNQAGVRDDNGKPLQVDGVMGNRTRAAVENYQRQHPGLVVDGRIGGRTMAAILDDANQMATAATQRASGDMNAPRPFNGTPENMRVGTALLSLSLNDPAAISLFDQTNAAGMASRDFAASQAAGVDPFSDTARAAADLGASMGWKVADAGAGPGVAAPSMIPSQYAFSPNENRGWQVDGSSFAAFNVGAFNALTELTTDRMAPLDGLSPTGTMGTGTGAYEGEVAFNATSAYARMLRDGTPSWLNPESAPPPDEPRWTPTGFEPAPAPAPPPAPAAGQDDHTNDVSNNPPIPGLDNGFEGVPEGGGQPPQGSEDPNGYTGVPEGGGQPSQSDLEADPSLYGPTMTTDDANALMGPGDVGSGSEY